MVEKLSGELKYTKRAFSEDSQQAMRGDIVRALVELLTNADDAYNAKGGSIQISIRNAQKGNSVILSVHDSATGLDRDSLIKCFTVIGEKNEKFSSNSGTRGLFGRGAKDVTAFGRTTFSAVKDGKFNSLEIDPNSYSWNLISNNAPVTVKELKELNLKKGESGLTASILLEQTFTLPAISSLIERIQNHVQLRDLIVRNVVEISDERSGKKHRLRWEEPPGTELLNGEFSVQGYKKKIKIIIKRLEQKEMGTVSSYSKHGLMISGVGATYENSFLHLSSRPESGWLFGRLVASEIDDLVREVDDPDFVPNPKNESRLVDRNRDGLVREHNYTRALSKVLNDCLIPIFDEIAKEEGSSRREGKTLRKKFDSLEKLLGDKLQELLNESDSGELPTIDDIEVKGNSLLLIPPKKLIQIGGEVTLSLRCPQDIPTDSLKLINSNPKILKVNDHILNSRRWKEHPRLDCLVNQIEVKALSVGVSEIFISNGEISARSEITVTETTTTNFVSPETLQFKHEKKSMPPKVARHFALLGPIEFAGETVNLSATGQSIRTLPYISMKANATGDYAIGQVRIESSDILGTSSLVARIGAVEAKCSIEVAEPKRNERPSIRFEFNGSDNPPRRVDTLMENAQLVVRIYGAHKSITKILGNYRGDKFERETELESLTLISEIIASELAIYAVEREWENHADRFPDASSIFVRQRERASSLLPSIQSLLM